MLAVAVAVVAIPSRSVRKICAENLIDDLDRVQNSGIVRRAQAEAHQGQRIGADDLDRQCVGFADGPILDGNESLQRRCDSVAILGSDPHVIAFDAGLAGEIAVYRVGPALDVVVPGVGILAQKFGGLGLAHGLREIGGNQQSSDFSGQRKRRIAAILFPAVLLRDWAVGDDEGRCFAHHRPPALVFTEAAGRIAAQQIDQQNRECGLIHLEAVPVGPSIQPHVLCPVSVGFLRGFEVMQHAQSVVVRARGQQSASTFDQIARPDKVIAAKVFIALVEAPGDGEAGDNSAEEVFGFVRAKNRHAGPVQVFFPWLLVELLQGPLPFLPVRDVVVARCFIGGEQGRDDLLTGLSPNTAKAEGEDELAVARG